MQAQGIDATLDLVEHVEPLELYIFALEKCPKWDNNGQQHINI
jgi:hypothetical protein